MEVDRVHIDIVRKVGLGTAIALSGSVLAAAIFSFPLALGVAVGGGLMLLLFELYRTVARVMLSAPTPRRARALFWMIWLFKWPLLAAVLYGALRTGLASPVGVALGVGVLPAVTVAIVLRAVLADAWRGWRGVHLT